VELPGWSVQSVLPFVSFVTVNFTILVQIPVQQEIAKHTQKIPTFIEPEDWLKKSRNIVGIHLGFHDPVGKELTTYVASQPRRS
jgi:hypothetical protein